MHVPHVASFWRVIDYLFIPVMWVVNGGKGNSLQETHWWHLFTIAPSQVADADCVTIPGREGDADPLWIHFSFFSSWKHYVVVEAAAYGDHWHVGWKIKEGTRKEVCQIQKLPIENSRIRLLVWPKRYSLKVFGVDEKGKLLRLTLVGKGTLGDDTFPGVRLF